MDKEGQRHDTCGGSGVFRVVRWRYFRLGQPVFNDLVAVVLEVTDQVSMHGLIIPQGPLGCLRILGIFLRIFSQNKKKDPFYVITSYSIHYTKLYDLAHGRDVDAVLAAFETVSLFGCLRRDAVGSGLQIVAGGLDDCGGVDHLGSPPWRGGVV